ncbi:MAG: AAA family ATPase [Nitrosopumilaceae archaeon]|nr:AAA family ATPase [Nitrosopumilaceae archaeon]
MSIVITGNPGVGKHTVVNNIKDIIKLPVLDLNKFAKESGLFEKISDGYEVDTDKLAQILQKEITVPHIIVGHLAPYSISKIPIKIIIILRRHPKELATVYHQRKYSEKKVKDNLGSEILGIIVNDIINNQKDEKIIQIDVTAKNQQQVTEAVLEAIKNEKTTTQIDWLSIMSDKELKEYFSYD